MPDPSNIDELYRSMIDCYIALIGPKAAYEALGNEVARRIDATQRHLYDLDGAFASKLAEILKDYPTFSIRFEKIPDGLRLIAEGPADAISPEDQADIEQRVKAASEECRQVNVPGITLTSRFEKFTRTKETGDE